MAATAETMAENEPGQSMADTTMLSPTTLEILQNVNIDPYDEDQAELRFLLSKPTCFVVFGKPGVGKTTLARRLAQEWKCQHVNATDVIMQAIDMQTEMGLKAQEILLRGEAIPEEMAAKMIEEKINSPEVAHHGYVLDGFPSLSEDYMSIRDQLELIKNWKLKPDFILNVKMPDRDLETRRVGQRVDPSTGNMYTKEMYDPDKPNIQNDDAKGDEEEEEEEDDEEEEAMPEEEEAIHELPAEVVERLVRRPEDLPIHVLDNIQTYKSNILRILEDYMADHDQQYLVELDGNKPLNLIFRELMQRLQCFVLRPAAVPIRLQGVGGEEDPESSEKPGDMEEEEMPEDVETDELIRTLSSKEVISPKYKWRRSRWLRYCPVALAEGNLLQGKPEFAVSFLDKIYVLSSGEAMGKFLKNPRPYLLPPQPRPPCKLCVMGPSLSGKTTLCHALAQKYGAKVLDIDELIKPRIEEERQKQIQQAKDEATDQAIMVVRTKLKEQMEAEIAVKEEQASDPEETAQETEADNAEGEKKEDDAEAGETAAEGEGENAAEAAGSEKADIAADEASTVTATTNSEATTIHVDAEHPEVKAIVDAAVKVAADQPINLGPETYIEVMEAAIQEAEKEMRKKNPDGPMNGGWILDNFPRTREQWSVIIEKGGMVPDDVICLRDESENGDFLIKRWYYVKRDEIDAQISERTSAEDEEKRKKEEESQRLEEERRLAEEEAARKAAEEERQRRIDEGEDPNDIQQEVTTTVDSTDVTQADLTVTQPPATPDNEKMPPDGPELEAAREIKKHFDQEWPSIQAVITGSTPIEPTTLEICHKNEEGGGIIPHSEEQIFKEAAGLLERNLQYQAWQVSAQDLEEEEEGGEEEEAGDEEEAGEEEEDPNRSIKKQLGDTNYFCPVALKEKGVLWPGNPECAGKYREKTYYFSNSDNREKFLADPLEYLPVEKPFTPPPIRLLVLGPRGSGKTVHGRNLANKLGIFHIQFHERLQELIIGKTKHKIGPEYEEERKEEEEVDAEDAEDLEDIAAGGAITAPDGTAVPAQPPATADSAAPAALEEDKKEEEEEEEVKFTEEEEAIKAYLESDEPLPSEMLEKIVTEWWNVEPFKSTGFVLEGFPRTTDELEIMEKLGLFPDAAIILAVEDGEVMARLLPPKMDRWRDRRQRLLAKRQKKKEIKQKKRQAEIAKRREELVKEMEEKKAERKAAREAERDSDEEINSDDEEVEEEEEEDIEGRLAEEFEEEEEEEETELETEEDAADRMRNQMAEVYDGDINRLASIQESLESMMVPRIELDAGRKPHITRYLLSKRLKKYITYRHSMFERVYPITEKLALRMLQVGYKQPSRFGRWCPVKMTEGDCIQPMQGPGYMTYPAIYRQHLYFLSSAQAREQFQQDPMTYINQATPKPVVPMRMAIIGPPKSGKTTLARRFADEYGLIRLSLGEAIRLLLDLQPNTELAKAIMSHLSKGEPVPDELSVRALEIALMDMRSQTRGFVLDGYPMTKQQVEMMTERSLIPVRIIELEADSRELVTRATKDRYSPDRILPLHDSAQILAIKLAAWRKEIVAVREWYHNEHANHFTVDGQRSKWWVWNRALEINKEAVVNIQIYLQRISNGQAASIANMCITPSEFEVRLGDFGQYCPVSLADKGELVDCSTNKCLDTAAEFRGHYYKMASAKELEQFLKEPEKYVPPLAPRKLPPAELLPKRRTAMEAKAMFPIQVELQGYCPVTFLDGKCRYESIIPGDPQLVVQYREKLYYFESEPKLLKFMRLPERYWNLKLPHKLPPKKDLMNVYQLPMLGFMEQTVSQAITKALSAVGNFKPKYPFLTPSRSSLVYCAYHLKAYNPRSSDYVRKKYKKKLLQFEEKCDLIRYLGDNMTKKYKTPTERPIDFDFKLTNFMSLKGMQPGDSWVQ